MKRTSKLGLFSVAVATSLFMALPVNAAEDCPRGDLDKRFCDRDGDLIADTPTDSSKWLDPDTLVFAYTPVEDPAVYKAAWKDFLDHLAKVTSKKSSILSRTIKCCAD